MKLVLALSLIFTQMAFAKITVEGDIAKSLWQSIDIIGKIENTTVVSQVEGQEVIGLDTVSCVFENYNACSFYANTLVGETHNRSFVIATDGTEKFMNALAKANIAVNEEDSRMDVTSILCIREKDKYSCDLEEYVQPVL